MMEIEAYLKQAIERKASDVHLVSGAQPALRIDTELVKLDEPKIESAELERAVGALLGEQAFAAFVQTKDKDISRQVLDFNFRINLHYQRGQLVLNARLIPFVVPTPEQVDFSEVLYNLTRLRDGLVLITGPSGSGKSTTLATMIDIMNHERRSHIITIEDPIEYVFTDAQSIVEQREIGQDTVSFAVALRSALRQDPNVIMVGEMRDLETINAALTAAETGHLVLSTLHTMSAADSISRVIDAFPAHQQNQVLTQLSLSLRAVVAQQIFPRVNGGLCVAREILINNQGVANLIRRNQISQISNIIQTSVKQGMTTMNNAIDQLVARNIIDFKTGENRKMDLDTKNVYY